MLGRLRIAAAMQVSSPATASLPKLTKAWLPGSSSEP